MKSVTFPKYIRVAALNIPSIFKLNTIGDKTVAEGYEGLLLNCLAEKLNFEYEVILPPEGGWGSRSENGTWDGIIGLIQNGKADFGMPALGMTEERSKYLDYSLTYTILEKIFVTKEAGEMPKIAAFTYPFTQNVWILYVWMMLTASVLFQRIIFRNVTLLRSFISVLGSIVSQSMENVRETPWRRVLLGLWLSIATVMPFLYNTSFLSFLTMPEKIPIPRTFEELSKEILGGKFKCLTPIGTVDRKLLRESNLDYLVKMVEIIEKNNWEYPFEKKFVEQLNGSIAVIMPKIGMNLLLGIPPYLNMKSSLDNMGVRYVGIGLKKEFCCKERLNSVLHGVLSGGLFEKWLRDQTFLATLHDRMNVKHEEENMQLTLDDLKLAFFTLLTGYALAFLVLLAEILIPRSFNFFYS
ncbi:lig_chan-Glu_bd domain-containing protein [Trichonephila clavata]|uniref:Lig_chan-Glu_bd domain-containing protein n=1 Tax=Trichonephila clavata TaxID=2740835 RepID=A0A8X6JDK9_TRICU|nr:lig_chan-Glu_bd domain-containing protein [Trichonephila clavata]